nr:cyclin-C isoform X7 [Ictidomys tridecemlineatus]
MGQEDMLLPLAWRIVNDTYRTDLCLLYPPFMIALACLHVACVVQQKDARQWFAELSVDMEKILEIIRVILKLYEQWKNFDERKEMATILSKMPKPKPPPNSSRRTQHLCCFIPVGRQWKEEIIIGDWISCQFHSVSKSLTQACSHHESQLPQASHGISLYSTVVT